MSWRVRHLDRVMLGAVIVIFTGFAIAYTRITPIGASPDEFSHLHYITGISDHFRLPPASEPSGSNHPCTTFSAQPSPSSPATMRA